jgi:hypothetical protein
MINELMDHARWASSNADSLSRLAIRMQNVEIALEQLHYTADLNAMCTLEGIVNKLTPRLQMKWAEEVQESNAFGYEPTFSDLSDFVNRAAKVANSRFGQLAERNMGRSMASTVQPIDRRREQPKAKIFVNSSNDSSVCRMCGASHGLQECQVFKNLDVSKRWSEAKRLGACFTCLCSSHRSRRCQMNKLCELNGCKRRHHPLLHYQLDEPESTLVCATSNLDRQTARLGVVPVIVETPKGPVRTLAFIDSGSDTTLITSSFVERWAINGIPTRLTISTVNGSSDCVSLKVDLHLRSINGNNTVMVQGAYSVKNIPVKSLRSVNAEASLWPHLRDITFPEVDDSDVSLLLGCDVAEVHRVQEQRFGGNKQPYANLTVFGWVLCGPTSKPRGMTSVNCSNASECHINEQLKLLYNNEFNDTSVESTTLSRDDHKALSIVSQDARIVNGHFEVPLPRKYERLPNNFVDAQRRAAHLKGRLIRDPQLLSRYTELMQRHIEKGFLEPATTTTTDNTVNAIEWYMPHHPVFNPKKPDKLRIVFDCAARYKDCSLNDTLFQGPDLTSSLVAVLLRFRTNPVAVSGDIEEMFLQVGVPKADRDSLRVLWWPHGQLNKDLAVYRMTVHPFGATSSPFCANFALQRCAEKFGCGYSESVKSAVNRNFYVDDCLASLPDTSSTVVFIDGLTQLLAKGGFRLTKWLSNNREVLHRIPESERAPCVKDLSSSSLPTERALGIIWNAETDSFVFQFVLKQRPATRRGLLSALSGLYDPLGFVAPWLLPGKLLLQNMCKKKLGWDDLLTDADNENLNKWIRTLTSLHELCLPRCIVGLKDSTTTELHLFCDASEVGYGAVAYICTASADGTKDSHIVFSKARVAPIKPVSVPRLELSAAVLAVRIYQLLKEAEFAEFSNICFWTDSMIVLYYINNTCTRFSTFVANRLSKIHDLSDATQWRYVKSSNNPADKASRGMHEFQFKNDWLCGPSFLRAPKESWPNMPIIDCNMDHIELKRRQVLTNVVKVDEIWHNIWERFSDWLKLLKAVAWLVRFKNYILLMKAGCCVGSLSVGNLKASELQRAELDIIKLVQAEIYSNEIEILSRVTARSPALKKSSLQNLRPILVEGVLRVGGRLKNMPAPFDTRHPIILPRRHIITQLIVRHAHIFEGHIGPTHLLASLRQKYWIPHGAAAVKEALRSCMSCRRKNALTGNQLMAPLPIERVTPGWHSFSETGLDYFGPFFVRQGRCLVKRYGCIFSCLQTRAVHLEIAHSLDTQSVLMCLTRFVARRGAPKNLYSDNGTNFVGADRELKALLRSLDQRCIEADLAPRSIQWHFIPPYASHRGGVWERMIKSVRSILSSVLKEQNPSDETLLTAFTDVERILNNRPIVPAVHNDPECLALTPNDLLLLRNNPGMNPHVNLTERYHSRWKQAWHIANAFWRRWTKEYIPLLQIRQKWLNSHRNFADGDVVLIVSDALPRDRWPLGRIVSCRTDSDGLVRTVQLKTKNGVIERDIRKLCLLEGVGVGSDPATDSQYGCRDTGPPQVGGGSSGLPHREGPLGTSRSKGAVL